MLKNSLRRGWVFVLLCLDKVHPKLATKTLHYRKTRKWPNLKNPKDFNEKLQWLKFNEDPCLKGILSDKFSVYKYVEEQCEEKILNTLIGVYDSVDDVVWSELPNKFAIKCTHGSGYNFIVKNKRDADKFYIYKSLRLWIKQKYGRKSLEYHYDQIKPRVIVESCIEDEFGFLPRDYKIYCFNGKARLVLVCSERADNLRLDFFDLEWKRLEVGHKENESSKVISKPICLNEMIACSERLSKPFKFVRIDFYDRDGEPIFGEFTFTPAANMANYYNDYGLKYLGDLLDLD